jgi:hypothetical protein
MKKTILSIITLLAFNLLILTSCGEEKKDLTTQNAKPATTNMTSTDKPQEEEKIEPASVVCKIYFKSDDIEEEDGTISKGEVGEREDFRIKKAYTFCYDSEDFQKLKIEGTGKQITIEIKEGNKTIYKKENIEIKDALTLSSKEVNFQMAYKYTISIRQNETSLFEGKIDSQGCM